VMYGTDAEGVGRDLLPQDWWHVGVAYAGETGGDDLAHGDGESFPDRQPTRTTTAW
jgi:hypothetical protein